jgi:hypothetical protein
VHAVEESTAARGASARNARHNTAAPASLRSIERAREQGVAGHRGMRQAHPVRGATGRGVVPPSALPADAMAAVRVDGLAAAKAGTPLLHTVGVVGREQRRLLISLGRHGSLRCCSRSRRPASAESLDTQRPPGFLLVSSRDTRLRRRVPSRSEGVAAGWFAFYPADASAAVPPFLFVRCMNLAAVSGCLVYRRLPLSSIGPWSRSGEDSVHTCARSSKRGR